MIRSLRFLIPTLLVSLCAPAVAASIAARVGNIADGDTLTVQFEDKQRVRVRLQGIDAPERSQAYSQASRRNLHELTMGKFAVASSSFPSSAVLRTKPQ